MFSLLFLKKKKTLIIYNKFNSSNLIISNNSPHSIQLLNLTNLVYMLKCPWGDRVSKWK